MCWGENQQGAGIGLCACGGLVSVWRDNDNTKLPHVLLWLAGPISITCVNLNGPSLPCSGWRACTFDRRVLGTLLSGSATSAAPEQQPSPATSDVTTRIRRARATF